MTFVRPQVFEFCAVTDESLGRFIDTYIDRYNRL